MSRVSETIAEMLPDKLLRVKSRRTISMASKGPSQARKTSTNKLERGFLREDFKFSQ